MRVAVAGGERQLHAALVAKVFDFPRPYTVGAHAALTKGLVLARRDGASVVVKLSLVSNALPARPHRLAVPRPPATI